jgi:hypothetical protein
MVCYPAHFTDMLYHKHGFQLAGMLDQIQATQKINFTNSKANCQGQRETL